MIKSNYLSYELRSLWNNAGMNSSIYYVKPLSKCLLHSWNTMKLSVVRTHNSTIITDQFFARIAEVSQHLVMQKTLSLQHWIHIISMRLRKAQGPTRGSSTIHHWIERLSRLILELSRLLVSRDAILRSGWIIRSTFLRIRGLLRTGISSASTHHWSFRLCNDNTFLTLGLLSISRCFGSYKNESFKD